MVGRDPKDTSSPFVPACGVGGHRPKMTSNLYAVSCKVCQHAIARKDPVVIARMNAALLRGGARA